MFNTARSLLWIVSLSHLFAACSSSGSGGRDAGGGADGAGPADTAALVADAEAAKDTGIADQATAADAYIIGGDAKTDAVGKAPDAATLADAGPGTPADARLAPNDSGAVVKQGTVTFTAFGAWFEAGYAQWSPVDGATGYKVHVKKAADADWGTVDAALLRGTRVDVPGLAGKVAYQLKVTPVLSSGEATAQASTVSFTPLAHDRSGFAFQPNSPNGNANGGYNGDGTPKADAEILYVDEATKDTVEMAVTKGKTTTTWKGIGEIMAARQSAKTETPLIIRIIGKVTAPAGVDSLSLLNIKNTKNVTVEGIGTDTLLFAWGLNIRGANNVEVRNLAFSMFTDDSVSIQTDNANLWIHHNDFMTGTGTGDKELGDGSCDIKDNSSFITVSYNHFIGTGKSSLVGMNDSAEFFVTFHHNFFDASHSRHPRVRWGSVHVYNNTFKGMTTYGAAASENSNLFVQNNTFENCVRPMIIASQGHDYKDLVPAGQTPGKHESILSGEAGGAIKQEGNVLDAVSQSWFDPKVDTGNGSSGAYNGFDGKFTANGYPCALDSAADAVAKTAAYAGRLGN